MMRSLLFVAAVSLVPVSSVLGAPDEKPAAYTFQMNDRPLTPGYIHLEGSAERPAVGDLVDVDRYVMILGEERTQSFLHLDNDECILWSVGPTGHRQAAAVTVKW